MGSLLHPIKKGGWRCRDKIEALIPFRARDVVRLDNRVVDLCMFYPRVRVMIDFLLHEFEIDPVMSYYGAD
jgi:hypothetical protein